MAATLLLADDSTTIRRVIELTFAKEDVRVIAVASGEEALERINRKDAPPDIILADVGMAGVNGYAIASHVKGNAALKQIPVLLLTGAFEPIDEAKARATGCDGVLVKPFEPEQLVGRVKELLAGRRSPALWPADLPRVDAPPERAAPAAKPAPPLPSPAAPPRTPPKPAPRPEPPLELHPGALRPAPKDAPMDEVVPKSAAPEWDAPATPAKAPNLDFAFESELDQLDAAFARLESPSFGELDDSTASDFAKDVDGLRGEGQAPQAPPPPAGDAAQGAAAYRAEFGDWDVKAPPPEGAAPPASPAPLARVPQDAAGTPHRLKPADRSESRVQKIEPEAPSGDAGKLSIAGAFSALLAAEQAHPIYKPPSHAPGALPEAAIEEVVKRVIARMTDDVVKKLVLDTAERLIREEIERIKGNRA